MTQPGFSSSAARIPIPQQLPRSSRTSRDPRERFGDEPPPFFACNPNEWPWDLEAVHGTPDFDDIVEWFLERHPQVDPAAAAKCRSIFLGLARGKTLTVNVLVDPELGDMTLQFQIYGVGWKGWPRTATDKALYRAWRACPEIDELFPLVVCFTSPDDHEPAT